MRWGTSAGRGGRVGKAEWGENPDFFGPRHSHREARLLRALGREARAAGPHLECAAGVGSFSLTLARAGRTVVAADASLRSLAVVAARAQRAGMSARVLPVVADVTRLPFRDRALASVTTAETLEHVEDDLAAALELWRVCAAGGVLAGTVPAGPRQWSAWDDWAGHQRRYTAPSMHRLLQEAGWEPRVTTWGWPLVRLYDGAFLKRVNRRRLECTQGVENDPALTAVAGLSRHRWLVRAVRALFALDRPFDGASWGLGRCSPPASRRAPEGGGIGRSALRFPSVEGVRMTKKALALFSALLAGGASAAMLEPGQVFPTWTLVDHTGATVASSDLVGTTYLLWYYPKALSPGCTKEGCELRDNFDGFKQAGVAVLGVVVRLARDERRVRREAGTPVPAALRQRQEARGEGRRRRFHLPHMGATDLLPRRPRREGPQGLLRRLSKQSRGGGPCRCQGPGRQPLGPGQVVSGSAPSGAAPAASGLLGSDPVRGTR